MRHSKTRSNSQLYMAFLTMAVLILPNVLLDITEINMSVMGKILNVFFPLSCYAFILSIYRKVGWGVITCFPFMLYASFQLVLLYLYGESIIAVDMFLNVVTTDFKEAGTLLENLTPAIVLVIILYFPLLTWAIVSVKKGKSIPQYYRLMMVVWSGGGVILSGIVLLIMSLVGNVSPGKDIFPINVINNMCTAFQRASKTSQYPESAKNFSYQASDIDSTRRAVVLIIGETSRPDRWELFGAERHTNPKLSQRENVHVFDRAVTQSNTTHKSVPLLLTPLTADNFESINEYKSIITAFKEAGFHTTWISNQPPNGAYNEHMGKEADTVISMKYVPDVELVKAAEGVLKNVDTGQNNLIVLHTYGAHFPYKDRYKGFTPTFVPDGPMIANVANKNRLLNAYDNAMIATDLAIDSMISVVKNFYDDAIVIYAADHGEDIFDDSRNKFLHASPAPTVYQLRVPVLVWTSDDYEKRKNISETMKRNKSVPFQPSVSLFHSVLDAGGISTPYYNEKLSIFSEQFEPYELKYLTDRNEGVRLEESGLRKPDVDKLKELKILK